MYNRFIILIKKFFSKDFFKYVLVHYLISLTVAAIFFFYMTKEHKKQEEALKKEIINRDELTKEKEGQYRKMVNYYSTERDLNQKLKVKNIELYNTIKDKDEKLLSLTNLVISLKPSTGNKPSNIIPINNVKDSLSFTSYYPDSTNYFVKHYGTISTKSNKIYNNWEFGKLDLDITLSQDKNGLWNTRVAGPDYLVVTKLTVDAQKPENFSVANKVKNIAPILGAGILYNLNSKAYDFKVGGGFEIKNKLIILGEINTNKNVGLGIYKRF